MKPDFMLVILIASFNMTWIGCGQATSESQANANEVRLILANTTDNMIPSRVIEIRLDAFTGDQDAANRLWVVADSTFEGECECLQSNERICDVLLVFTQFKPNEEKQLTLRAMNETGCNPSDRTHAELSPKRGGTWQDRKYIGGEFTSSNSLTVPPEHTDHSGYFRYEGPGWESETVGYRLYLDWRNAIDVFGKKKTGLALSRVGLDGFDSYHEMADWGMDIMKVGASLGIGSPACWNGTRAVRIEETDSVSCTVKNANLRSGIKLNYHGWDTGEEKTDAALEITIDAGSPYCAMRYDAVSPHPPLCTGIAISDSASMFKSSFDGRWAYIATWGRQSIENDLMGLAVFYRDSDLEKISQDSLNHIVRFREGIDTIDYGILATWEQEPEGPKTQKAFTEMLDLQLSLLNNSIEIRQAQ